MKKKNSSDESKIEKISNSQPYLKKINEKARKSLASQDFNRVKKNVVLTIYQLRFVLISYVLKKKYAQPTHYPSYYYLWFAPPTYPPPCPYNLWFTILPYYELTTKLSQFYYYEVEFVHSTAMTIELK